MRVGRDVGIVLVVTSLGGRGPREKCVVVTCSHPTDRTRCLGEVKARMTVVGERESNHLLHSAIQDASSKSAVAELLNATQLRTETDLSHLLIRCQTAALYWRRSKGGSGGSARRITKAAYHTRHPGKQNLGAFEKDRSIHG